MIHDVARFARRICGEDLWPAASGNMTKAIKKAPREGAQMQQASQETTNPSHGYDPVEREGLDALEQKDNQQAVDADSKLNERLLQVIHSSELITSQKLILTVVALEEKNKGYCDLTYDQIAEHTSLSRRIIATHMPLLEKAGWLERTQRSRTYSYRFIK
jgi:hypothetical protein